MRCLIAVVYALGVTGCANTGPGPVTSSTAIYSPPVRLGGQGTMLFLPARSSDTATRDEGAALAALHRVLDPRGEIGCLNPVLGKSEIDASYRKASAHDLRDEIGRRPTRAELRQSLVSEASGTWGMVDEKGTPLTAALDRDVSQAFADAVLRAPPERPVVTLTADQMPGLALKEGCLARLDRPTIHNGWAFISQHSPTAGHLYALRLGPTGWTVVAHRFTAIA